MSLMDAPEWFRAEAPAKGEGLYDTPPLAGEPGPLFSSKSTTSRIRLWRSTVRVQPKRRSGEGPYSTLTAFCSASMSSMPLPWSSHVVGSSSASAWWALLLAARIFSSTLRHCSRCLSTTDSFSRSTSCTLFRRYASLSLSTCRSCAIRSLMSSCRVPDCEMTASWSSWSEERYASSLCWRPSRMSRRSWTDCCICFTSWTQRRASGSTWERCSKRSASSLKLSL
mmetsp:Transcript_4854/g.12426  ORF Transcript_4854/g.12426 Transcript_4854/m.12426 type:complete len:225 (-) Transcript_4854:167-841(-)